MKYIIEPLNTQHNRDDFDSEEASLNDFLKFYARQNDSKGLGKTYVAVLPAETRVFGYYTISSGSVSFDDLPEKMPRYPVPIVHLGRLAVDKTAKGEGLGAFLLVDAFRRTLKVADQLGIYAVEVRALSEPVRNFYLKFGFVEMNDNRFHLYLTIKKIRKLAFI